MCVLLSFVHSGASILICATFMLDTKHPGCLVLHVHLYPAIEQAELQKLHPGAHVAAECLFVRAEHISLTELTSDSLQVT